MAFVHRLGSEKEGARRARLLLCWLRHGVAASGLRGTQNWQKLEQWPFTLSQLELARQEPKHRDMKWRPGPNIDPENVIFIGRIQKKDTFLLVIFGTVKFGVVWALGTCQRNLHQSL